MPSSVSSPGLSTPSAGRGGPRDRIYPHRSVRALPLPAWRVAAGILLAILLSGVTAWYAVPLMALHSRLAGWFAGRAGLPVSGWVPVDVFPSLEPGEAPVLAIPRFADVSDGARLAAIGAILVLLVAARRFSLFRNLAYFIVTLLFGSAVAWTFIDGYQISSVTFGQIWLRQEMLVWLIAPWVLLLLFILPQPSLARGLGWVLFLHLYGFVFSALRMVFVLGVLHYSGMLFMPVLWFVFGTLSDLLFVLFFYSFSIHGAAGRLWGERDAWRSHF